MGKHRRQIDGHMKLGLGCYQTCGSRRDADLKKWIQIREQTEPLPSRTCGMVQTSNSKVPLNIELDVWTHICPREFSMCLQFLEISHRVVGLINALKENHFPLSRLKELSILGVFKILIDIEKKSIQLCIILYTFLTLILSLFTQQGTHYSECPLGSWKDGSASRNSTCYSCGGWELSSQYLCQTAHSCL